MIYLILIAGFLLRLVNLNQSLWLDESIEVLAVKNHSYLDLITKYALGDFHPPLYHLILKFWDGIFGYSETASRFPSIIFGVITCYFVYLIGKKLFSQKAGILAGLFMALNPLAIYYSQEARMYSLAMMAVTAAVYFLLSKKWIWFTFFLALSLYTDYLPYLMLPVYWLITDKKKALLYCYIVSLVTLIPWLPYFWQQLHIGTSAAAKTPLWGQVVGGLSLKTVPLTFIKFIIGRISSPDKIIYGAVSLVLALFYLYLIYKGRKRDLLLWLLIPAVLGVIISLKIPVFSYFRFLFIVPAFILLIAGGAQKKTVLAIPVVLISLLSLAIFTFYPGFQREDWRSAVNYMESSGTLVLMPSLAQVSPLDYYRHNLTVMDKNNVKLSGQPTVFLARYVQELFDPQDSLQKLLLSSGYRKTGEKSFNGVLIWKYQL